MYNKEVLEYIYGNYEVIIRGFTKSYKREDIEDAISRFTRRLLKNDYEKVEHLISFTYVGVKGELLNGGRTKISKACRPISSFNKEQKKVIQKALSHDPMQVLEDAMDHEKIVGPVYEEIAKLPPGQKNAVVQFMLHNGYQAFKTNTEKAHFNVAIRKLKLALNAEFRLADQKKKIEKAMEEIVASF